MELPEIIELTVPIKEFKLIWNGDAYFLMIKDFNGDTHYFNKDGTYGGNSRTMLDGTMILTSKNN